MRRMVGIMLVGIALSGCVTSAPSQEALAKANYGSPTSQKEAEEIALDLLKQTLKDPESTKIEWGEIQKGWMREAPIAGLKLRFGYLLTASINSKNSYGGYTGYKPYQFFYFNKKIVSVYAETESSDSRMEKIY